MLIEIIPKPNSMAR